MNNLPSLNFISNTSSTTISVMQSTKNNNIGNSLVTSVRSPASNNVSLNCLKSNSQIAGGNTNNTGTNKVQVTKSKPSNGNHTSIKNNNSSCSIINSNTGIPSQNNNTSIKEINNITPNLNILPSSPTKQQSS